MSLLGRQVFANPTTPIWGQGGSSSPAVSQLFDYADYSGTGGLVLPVFPSTATVNTLTFTAPADGFLYMEAMARFIGVAAGGAGILTFGVNGTLVTDPTPMAVNAYAGNTNFICASMFQIAVLAGQTYVITAEASTSDIPPSDPDAILYSSRLLILYSQ